MRAAPVVGLTTYREPAAWGVWHEPADVLPAGYARIVESVGGAPVLLPPAAADRPGEQVAGAARAVVARLDGLVVSGGADVDPAAYGEGALPATGAPRGDRDAWELALLGAAEEAGLPVLGICRGLQVMAVHAGGSLHQHLPDVVGHHGHSPTSSPDAYGEVEVTVKPGSRLAGLVGEVGRVRCHHHQAVREHPGLEAVAWADDGTLEAAEAPGERFWVGVQWHPETLADVGLVAGLVAAAATLRS